MSERFVILFHSGQGNDHFDFMLEHEGVLATWQFLNNPLEIGQTGPFSATKLPDHRLAYLDYEGSVSDNRGSVQAIDRGLYRTVHRGPRVWRIELESAGSAGIIELTCLEEPEWLLRRG